jgi:DNA-binding CsgD family transcriptional regulator/tetratricopeptide (TPR) repeat protein
MKLLEREHALISLDDALNETISSNGQVVLISGEAGIGKTSLIEYFSQSHDNVRFLRGTCDPLFTPHPLCPLHDIAQQLSDSELADLLWGADRMRVFYTFLKELQQSSIPTVVIFEDVHWADEATLDLIRFLGRRIHDTQSMVIVTYRDDELDADHPLWLVLGYLSGPDIHRIQLHVLSEQAVTALAEESENFVENLYEVTGGNPFYVAEMLAASYDGVPRSVREAVLARVQQIPSDARNFLELASIVPKERFDRNLYQMILNPSTDILNAITESGLVRLEADAIIFRHELARLAIAESLPSARWHELNTLALDALLRCLEEGQHVSRAHIVHHAHQAGNSEVVLRFVSDAAQEASGLGAHRQAASHYQSGLVYADHLTAEEQADLLEKLAYECYLTGQITDAVQYRTSALDIRRILHHQAQIGENLRWLSRLNWFLGERTLAERYAVEAVETLEHLSPSPELAMAYSNRAQLDMLSYNVTGAVHWGNQAIDLAQELGCTETLVHAMNNVGAAQWFVDNATAQQHLKESLRSALKHNYEEHAARAYTNLGAFAVVERQYNIGKMYLDEGIDYATNHDLDSWSFYMQGWRARLHLEQGDWDQATKEAADVVKMYHGTIVIRLPALEVLTHLRIRRGDPRADELLEEVYEYAQHTNELQRIAPLVSIKAETAWLKDDLPSVVDDLIQVSQWAADPWTAGRLTFWLWRAGEITTPPDDIASPFRLQIMGDWCTAADEWANIGCPFEQTLALMDGDEEAQKTALSLLEQLGAAPVIDWLRRKMRLDGVKGIVRGPRRDTLENPAGLTQRQMEVLGLLIDGLSDNEIAEQLFISPKTAGHHVSAILGKLDVRSRQEAAVLAVQRGWVVPKD